MLEEDRKNYLRSQYNAKYFAYPNGHVYKCGQKGDSSFEGVLAFHLWEFPEPGEIVCVGWFCKDEPCEVFIYKITKEDGFINYGDMIARVEL